MRYFKQVFFMCALLMSAVAMLAIVSLRRLPAAPGRGAGATITGDVNCDGALDIGDPVYLLNYLFLGGKEPCLSAQQGEACCPELAAKLDRVIAALEDPCREPLNRLTYNEDSTVTDHCTGLMWEQNTAVVYKGLTREVTRSRWLPRRLGSWREFVRAAAKRFAGRVDHWRI